jgi:hypothetical protein
MKKILLFLAAITLAIGIINCKKDPQKIIVSWGRTVNRLSYTNSFSDGDIFSGSAGSNNSTGSYSLSGNEITISDPDLLFAI